MKNLYIQLPDDIYDQLRTKSLKEKTPMKEIVTKAISLYMFKQPQTDEQKDTKKPEKTLLGLFVQKKKGDMKFTL